MNPLNTAKRAQVIAALIEGKSINATCRMLELPEKKPNARADRELVLKALNKIA